MMPFTCSPVRPRTAPSSAADCSSGTSTRTVVSGSSGSGCSRTTGPALAFFGETRDVVAHHAVGEHVAVRVDDVAARAVRRSRRSSAGPRPPRSARRRARPGCRPGARRTRRRSRPARRPRGGSAASGVGSCGSFAAFLVGSVRGGCRQAVGSAAAGRPAARRALRPAPSPGVRPARSLHRRLLGHERHAGDQRIRHERCGCRCAAGGRGAARRARRRRRAEVDRVARSAPCRAPRRSRRGSAATRRGRGPRTSVCSSRSSVACSDLDESIS